MGPEVQHWAMCSSSDSKDMQRGAAKGQVRLTNDDLFSTLVTALLYARLADVKQCLLTLISL